MRVGFGLAMAGAVLCAAQPGWAQDHKAESPHMPPQPIRRVLPTEFFDKPSQAPAFAIPIQPLGFTAPPAFYLGNRESFVSLDFIDEDRLLFTFRVPGLIHRETSGREAGDSDERQIRALVLALPAGTVEAEALWTLHDRVRYLWMLKDGHFLLRDRENIEMGDAALELKPYLRFPGPLFYLEMDPGQRFMVTDSIEPETKPEKPSLTIRDKDALPYPGEHASLTGDPEPVEAPAVHADYVVRILLRDSGRVMLVSRTNAAVHLPISGDGYLEKLRARDERWLLNLKYFAGGSAVVGHVDSTCSPLFEFVAQKELLAATCTELGEGKLVAMETNGRRLWEYRTLESAAWPLLLKTPDGSRLAWEALIVNRPIGVNAPLDQDDVKAQVVEVLDAADGKLVLDAPVSPALDAGGNVAISPSGRRVAVLNAGQIQVFELPQPEGPLPDHPTQRPAN